MTDLGVPCPVVVRLSVTAEARHLCPFKDEVDQGTVTLEWTTAHGETVELHALAALIDRFAGVEISHEQWTAELVGAVSRGVRVAGLRVVSSWVTGGLTVEVEGCRGTRTSVDLGGEPTS